MRSPGVVEHEILTELLVKGRYTSEEQLHVKVHKLSLDRAVEAFAIRFYLWRLRIGMVIRELGLCQEFMKALPKPTPVVG